jgi:hypothetical protein
MLTEYPLDAALSRGVEWALIDSYAVVIWGIVE